MKHRQRIIEEITADPRRSGKEIAAAVGCSPNYVSLVCTEEGIAYGKGIKRKEKSRGVYVTLSHENHKWLKKHLISSENMPLLINTLITDARLDDERAS